MDEKNFEEKLSDQVRVKSSDLYFDFVKYMNDHSFTNDMLRYMLREFVALSSLLSYDEQFREIMDRFFISCKDVESQLNTL